MSGWKPDLQPCRYPDLLRSYLTGSSGSWLSHNDTAEIRGHVAGFIKRLGNQRVITRCENSGIHTCLIGRRAVRGEMVVVQPELDTIYRSGIIAGNGMDTLVVLYRCTI